jgi:hypothetical protein
MVVMPSAFVYLSASTLQEHGLALYEYPLLV